MVELTFQNLCKKYLTKVIWFDITSLDEMVFLVFCGSVSKHVYLLLCFCVYLTDGP